MNLNKKLLVGIFVLSILFTMMNFQFVAAAQEEPDREVNISGDSTQKRIEANERVQFQFRERTRLTLQADCNMSVDIECDGEKIGDKEFELEVDGDGDEDLELTIKCVEEEKELGLLKGNTYQARNRNRYLYQEGFCAQIECNDSCEAKLKMKATEENKNAVWAYYDEDEEEWVTVETVEEDGFLVAETDHFSTWTLLNPETDYTLIIVIGVGVGAAVIAAIAIVLIKKRKSSSK